ncbi:MAG: amino acid ABC transporter permease [Spirochaetaceae bacterium]|jgi:L-cystine transport system permease protein|nr:amino acid ABC transporter permease [Spirochaetaceae bacterium]
MFQWAYVWRYLPRILQAVPVTLLIVAVAISAGVILGMAITFIRVEKVPVLRRLSVVFVSFMRGTPMLVQLFIVYYGLPALLNVFGINIMRASKLFFVFVTYSLNSAAFLSENFRAAIESIDRDQWDAAASVGLGTFHVYTRVIIPQSVVIAIPSVGTHLSHLLQDTSLAFAIGVMDMVGKISSMSASIGHSLEAYLVASVIFILLSFGIERSFALLEKKTSTRNGAV